MDPMDVITTSQGPVAHGIGDGHVHIWHIWWYPPSWLWTSQSGHISCQKGSKIDDFRTPKVMVQTIPFYDSEKV